MSPSFESSYSYQGCPRTGYMHACNFTNSLDLQMIFFIRIQIKRVSIQLSGVRGDYHHGCLDGLNTQGCCRNSIPRSVFWAGKDSQAGRMERLQVQGCRFPVLKKPGYVEAFWVYVSCLIMNFGGMYFEIVDFKFVFETLTLLIFYLRLVIAIILFGDEEMVSLLATECCTFIHMNSGTSKRSHAMPDGDSGVPSVLRANGLAARSCLLILVLVLLGHTFLLEQPGSSVLMLTKRMQWLCAVLQKHGIAIFKQAFWMSCFGHSNPKRTVLWSNNVAVRVFTTPKIATSKIKGPPTAERYVSKRTGKCGYKGSKHLKSTEHPDCTFDGLMRFCSFNKALCHNIINGTAQALSIEVCNQGGGDHPLV